MVTGLSICPSQYVFTTIDSIKTHNHPGKSIRALYRYDNWATKRIKDLFKLHNYLEGGPEL